MEPKRIPRPKGITFLVINVNLDINQKENLLNRVISQWTLQGFYWNNTKFSIHSMAHLLKISTQELMDRISEISLNLGSLASPQNIENTLKTLITLSTTFSLEDRGAIQNQLNTLLQSQGNSYKPFVSSEVNKAFKLLLESNKNLLETYKTITTNTNNNNILNIFPKSENYLTPEKALEIINHKTTDPKQISHSTSTSLSEELYQEHGVGDFPAVRAGDSGGLNIYTQLPNSQPATQPQNSKPDSHSDAFKRRNLEVIDTDEIT